MNTARRQEILKAYIVHARRFDRIASRRNRMPRVRFQAAGATVSPEREQVLSGRQLEVLALVADGFSNPEIGRALTITTETVKTHVQRIYRTLGARNRAHAVDLGYLRGLLTTPVSV